MRKHIDVKVNNALKLQLPTYARIVYKSGQTEDFVNLDGDMAFYEMQLTYVNTVQSQITKPHVYVGSNGVVYVILWSEVATFINSVIPFASPSQKT